MLRNRRAFLASLGTAAVGALALPRGIRASAHRYVPGVQLYTVRSLMARDPAGTLAAVAEIGCRTVEFAGYYGMPPARARALLARTGLTAPSAHVGWAELTGAAADALGQAAEVGHEYVTVPWLPPEARASLDDWRRTAARLNRLGADAQAAGLCLAYHNHDFELASAGDVVPLELLLAETDPDLVTFQLDVYWLSRAGHDPLAWLERHGRRVSMLHLKDTGGPPEHPMRDVGAGVLDFAAILAAARRCGVRHVFIEHDRPADALASVRSSFRYLSSLEY